MYRDTTKRSVVKTLFFKIITTAVTAMITGLGNALFIHALMTIIYLVYERVWNRIDWGRKPIKIESYELLRNEQTGYIPNPQGYTEPVQS